MMRTFLSVAVLLAACALNAPAQETPPFSFTNFIHDWTADAEERADGQPNLHVSTGLLADRDAQTVQFLALATGMDQASPVEFILIAPHSGHDYEAIARSAAPALDTHRALEFIGMEAGEAADPDAMRFWPKGERVDIRLQPLDETGSPAGPAVYAEDTIFDVRTSNALPRRGWVFTGSQWQQNDEGDRIYLAEEYDPGSIASIYSEPQSVLDVPEPTGKGNVYGYLYPHPDPLFAERTPLLVTVEPQRKRGEPDRVITYDLQLSKHSEQSGKRLSGITIHLHRGTNRVADSVDGMVQTFRQAVDRGHDPFVRVTPKSDVKLVDLRAAYAFLKGLEGPDGIRLEPPPPGHLFYRAFLPDENYRDPALRPSQPWELHLRRIPNGSLSAELVKQTRRWPDEGEPFLETNTIQAASPADAVRTVEESDVPFAVLLIFVEDSLTYGDLLEWAGPFLSSHPIQYVFLPR